MHLFEIINITFKRRLKGEFLFVKINTMSIIKDFYKDKKYDNIKNIVGCF